jgi:hypothetical protein
VGGDDPEGPVRCGGGSTKGDANVPVRGFFETQKKFRTSVGVVVLLLMLAMAAWPASAQDWADEPDAPVYNLLTNPSMELYDATYGRWRPWHACFIDKQVATGWHRFTSGASEPAWLDARVFADSCLGSGWVECIKGSTCQFIAGLDPYNAGIYQTVTGLTPGVGYGFHAAMLTIWMAPDEPVNNDRILKQIGIDPKGGTDPLASTVVWSEVNGVDKAWDLQQRVALLAEGTAMTVFVRVISLDPADHWRQVHLSIVDSAIVAQTPTVSASSPEISSTPSFWVSWNNVVLAPGAKAFQGVDVEWMDEAVGVWNDWLAQNKDGGATFMGEYGHTYRFRARAWQQYKNNSWLCGPYSTTYDSRTSVIWARMIGHVVSPDGRPIYGAQIHIAETGQTASTAYDGFYLFYLPPGQSESTVSVSSAGWQSTAAAHGVAASAGAIATVDWVLRPPDDAVLNGEFEDGLAGWEVTSDAGVTPAVVAEPVHTGYAALELGGEAVPAHTAAVCQTVALANSWEPALSFLYWPMEVDQGDAMSVELTLTQEISLTSQVTTTWMVTPSLDVDGWTHFWTYVGPAESPITGTLSMRFRVYDDGGSATVVYLDEVSVGATPGGPYRAYLPIAFKRR